MTAAAYARPPRRPRRPRPEAQEPGQRDAEARASGDGGRRAAAQPSAPGGENGPAQTCPPSAPPSPPGPPGPPGAPNLARLNLAAPAVMRAGLAKALQAGPVAFIDVGASKVAWLIGRLERGSGEGAAPLIRTLAAGEAPSLGVGYGGLVDLASAASAVRAARDAAETALAGGKAMVKSGDRAPTLTLHKSSGKKTIWSRAAAATLPGARPRSAWTGAEIAVKGAAVTAEDAARAIAGCPPPREEDGRLALHAEPIGWRIDGEASPAHPVGLRGDSLEVELHVLSGAEAAARNLDACLAAAETTLLSVAAGAHAAGFGALTEAERRDGAAVVDLGAAEATIGIFAGGRLVFGDALRLGANRATEDLMRAFDIGWEDAERLKTLDGSLADRDALDGWSGGEGRPIGGRPDRFERADAAAARIDETRRLLRARWRETLELIRDRLQEGGFRRLPTRRVVLAGGGAATPGIAALAGHVLGASTRLARPTPPKGAPAHFGGPAYAALAGLAAATIYDLTHGRPGAPAAAAARPGAPRSSVGRLSAWLRRTW